VHPLQSDAERDITATVEACYLIVHQVRSEDEIPAYCKWIQLLILHLLVASATHACAVRQRLEHIGAKTV
jgi:hypothetical protein